MTMVDDGRTIRLPVGGPFTLEDWDAVRDQDEYHRIELVDGGFLVVPSAASNHTGIQSELIGWFVAHGYRARHVLPDAGVVTGGAGDNPNARIPDLVVLSELPPTPTTRLNPALVRLAVEVVGPSTRTQDRQVKPAEYANVGIANFWRIELHGPDIDSAQVVRHRLIDGIYQVVGVDTLEKLLAGAPILH
jgi:Uma2 family endonuclease